MGNSEKWNEFVNSLIFNAIKMHRESKEGEYLKLRQAQIDEMLTTNLTPDQKSFVDEILFELTLATERETDVMYQQGLKDCVWMLKTLGVLA